MKEYFIIFFGEDGVSIRPATKKEVESLIEEIAMTGMQDTFVTKSHYIDIDSNYPLYHHMIIKGELVVPKPVQVVTKYEI